MKRYLATFTAVGLATFCLLQARPSSAYFQRRISPLGSCLITSGSASVNKTSLNSNTAGAQMYCAVPNDTNLYDFTSTLSIGVDLITTGGTTSWAAACYTLFDQSAYGCNSGVSPSSGAGWKSLSLGHSYWASDTSAYGYTTIYVNLANYNEYLTGIFVGG